MTFFVRDKRINAHGNAVFDLYRVTPNGFEHHQATIELGAEYANRGGMKVLLGALSPSGKERAWDAIRSYELVQS